MNSMFGWCFVGSVSIVWMIGVNRCCWWIIVIIVKNIISSVVNGRVFWKVWLIWCLLVMLVKVVISMIINRLIRLILVICRVSLMISISVVRVCISSVVFCCVLCLWFLLVVYLVSIWCIVVGNWVLQLKWWFFFSSMQVSRLVVSIGMDIGVIWWKNLMKCQLVLWLISRFCGFFIRVQMLFSVVLIVVCMSRLWRKVWNFLRWVWCSLGIWWLVVGLQFLLVCCFEVIW